MAVQMRQPRKDTPHERSTNRQSRESSVSWRKGNKRSGTRPNNTIRHKTHGTSTTSSIGNSGWAMKSPGWHRM